jgi:hypothetical protein
MGKRTGVVVGFLALAGLIGFIVRLPGGGGGSNAPRSAATSAPVHDLAAPTGNDVGTSESGSGKFSGGTTPTTTVVDTGSGFSVGSGGSGGGGVTTTGGGSSSGGGGIAPLPTVGGGRGLQGDELVGPRIIETAQVSLVTRRGEFGRSFDRATQIARTFGGYVESSSTSGVRNKYGQLTIRVPSSRFQQALGQLKTLGRVEGQTLSGQDVTAQYVDLQARRRNWEAQERALLALMARATTIGQTLRIQNELSQVQMRIEELKGQLQVLNDQTTFATIQVAMRERGSATHPNEPKKDHQSTLGQAWDDARHGFVGVLAAVVVGLGYLIPITALLALVWLWVRRTRPRVA